MWCVLCCFFKRVNIFLRPLLLKFLKFFFALVFCCCFQLASITRELCTALRHAHNKEKRITTATTFPIWRKSTAGRRQRRKRNQTRECKPRRALSHSRNVSNCRRANCCAINVHTPPWHNLFFPTSVQLLPTLIPHWRLEGLHGVAAVVFSSSSSSPFYSANQKCWYWALPGLLSEA